MITKELEENINTVRTDARRRGLEQMTVEHLALVLIKENTSVREMLVDCNADVNGLKEKLKQYVASNIPTVKTYGEDPTPSPAFKRVLQRALSAHKNNPNISGLHVLAAVFSEPESYAAYYMQKFGVERLTLLTRLSQGAEAAPAKKTAARQSGNDLVARAAAGQLEKPGGRQAELALLMRVLSCKYKNNALLVGEPGVGKTAVVHALAHRIAAGDAPAAMKTMRIIAVKISELVAGTKYRGDFEQRVQQLADKCRAHGNTVVFIDEIHTLVGAGAVSGGALDGANILKPMLEEESIRTIGVTTQGEYRRIFEKDQALARRFSKITVQEPDAETLAVIMQNTVERLGRFHGAQYADDAAADAVALSRRYLPARCLPDKAIMLLDEAGACRRLLPQPQPIGREDLEQLARQAAGLPPLASEDSDKHALAQLRRRLSEAVLDQDEAAEKLSRAVLCGRLNYKEEQKVIGAFLFYGPTGVGKTEMAKQLAQQLEMRLLRYDMSEYREPHSLSRLIGAPPGYVGFEQSGKLIEDIVRCPNAVVLFDEVEKAHPEVLNILLQILDYGTLTDNIGRSADFSNAAVILTSNLGCGDMERGAAGFARAEADRLAAGDDAVRKFFTPEMRNRMDALIRFQPLAPATIARIADSKLAAVQQRLLLKKNIHLAIGAGLRRRLQSEGYHPAMGARPLQRLIKTHVLEALALAEAAGDIRSGGRYRLEEDGVIVRPRARRRQAVTA